MRNHIDITPENQQSKWSESIDFSDNLQNSLGEGVSYIWPPSFEDAEQIAKVVKNAWLETYPNPEQWVYKEDLIQKFQNQNEHTRIFEKLIEKIDQNTCFLVAKSWNETVWVVYAKLDEGKPFLIMLYIDPEYQWKKIWSKLMEQFFDFYSEYDELFLEVASYNEKAINFYKKFWFEETWESWYHTINENVKMPKIKLKYQNHKN